MLLFSLSLIAMYSLRFGLIWFLHLQVSVNSFLIKPIDIVELLYVTNCNTGFKELDFFNSSICKCWCVDPFHPLHVLNFFFTYLL